MPNFPSSPPSSSLPPQTPRAKDQTPATPAQSAHRLGLTPTGQFLHPHSNAEIEVQALRRTSEIRQRCARLLHRAREGGSSWFTVHDPALERAAETVAEVTRRRYRHGHIPPHSWWRRLEAGGIDRRVWLAPRLAGLVAGERAHAQIDLASLGVFLGGHAGPAWRYHEALSGRTFTGCEGLAVAAFHAFASGLFSSREDRPLQVDAEGLRALQPEHLALAFQSTPSHPLHALEPRAVLLRRLGEVLQENPEVFGAPGRPGVVFDLFSTPYGFAVPGTADVRAHDILSQLLQCLSGLWPAGHEIAGTPIGDCWRHAAVRADDLTDGWVPFHQHLQWLTYSLVEPFESAGILVRGLDALTALPGRHQASLMLDTGVLRLREPVIATELREPGDEAIVEWRALTLALHEDLAPRLREILGLDEKHCPMGCILEGGTRAAGQMLAARLRDGAPALRVSDGALGF